MGANFLASDDSSQAQSSQTNAEQRL